MGSRLPMSQQCALAEKMADSVISCIKGIMSSRQREEIILLYLALARSCPEYSIQF